MNSISSDISHKKKAVNLKFTYLDRNVLVTYRTDSDDLVEIYLDNVIKTRIERNGEVRNIEFSVGNTIHNMEIWFKKEKDHMFIHTGINGPGILIDGIPVENTLADKSFYIKNARIASIAFLILLLLKIVVPFIHNINIGIPLILNIVNISVYILAFLVMVVSIIGFKKHPKIGSYILAILCSVETIDYLVGVYLNVIGGENVFGASVLIFTALRISFIIISIKTIQIIHKNNKNTQI